MNFNKPSNFTSGFLTIAIVLFLTLDMTMLALNFKITREVAEDSLIINLTGRQRMLSQRMSKLLFQIQDDDVRSLNNQMLVAQFNEVYDLFTSTLMGLQKGGVVEDAESKLVTITPFQASKGPFLIREALTITSSMESMVAEVQLNGLTRESLLQLKGSLIAHGDVLLEMMNDLTVIAEKDSRAKTERLRTIQLVTFLLAMCNFIVIVRAFRAINRQSIQNTEMVTQLLQATNAALIIFDHNRKVVMANSSACALFGYDSNQIQTMHYGDLVFSEDQQLMARTSKSYATYIEMHERKIFQAKQEMLVATVLDISHHFEQVKTLSKLAQKDALTGLLNRAAMQVSIQEKIQKSDQFGLRFACFFIDLNNFKQINDTYGHPAGDYVLKAFSSRLKSSIRNNDLLYRYGGDEFILLVDLFDNNSVIEKVSIKIIDSIASPIILPDGNEVELFVSAGITIYPDDASTPQELLNLADKLMYRSKQTHQFEFYHQPDIAV